jgi:ABC-type Fe3+ transport system permease subunit
MMNSRSSIFGRRVLLGLAFLFLAPYLFSLVLSKGRLVLPVDFLDLVLRSTLQAALSGGLATLFGLLGAGFLLRTAANGAASRASRRVAIWEGLALFPAVIPSGVIVLGLMDLVPDWRGLWAIAIAHTFISSGFISVVLARLIRERMGASLELGWTEGASRWLLWRRGVLPRLGPELYRVGLTVFVSSLGSFSVPLLLGGSKAYTFEIAIHHAIRLQGAWGVAATLSIFQLLMLVMFLFLFQNLKTGEVPTSIRSGESTSRAGVGRIVGFSWGAPFLIAGTMVSLFSLVRDPLLGWRQLQSTGLLEHQEMVLMALQGSLATAALSGCLTAALLLLAAIGLPGARARRWMNAYVAPSVAITGFSTLALGWGSPPSFNLDVLRISIGASLLFAPVIWRLRWAEEVGRLAGVVAVAETLGADLPLIAKRILLPRLLPTAFWSGGLVAFWMWGDYAIGSIVASRNMTLGLLAKSLMESYRLEAAALLFLVILVLGALTYRLFTWGGSSVHR